MLELHMKIENTKCELFFSLLIVTKIVQPCSLPIPRPLPNSALKSSLLLVAL